VIDAVDDCLLDDSLEHTEVHHVPGAVADRPGDGDVERVVVPMPVRIVTAPEELLVLLFGERGIVHAMGGVELEPPGDGDVRHLAVPKKKKLRTLAELPSNENEEDF
jgi:hypothetical protein